MNRWFEKTAAANVAALAAKDNDCLAVVVLVRCTDEGMQVDMSEQGDVRVQMGIFSRPLAGTQLNEAVLRTVLRWASRFGVNTEGAFKEARARFRKLKREDSVLKVAP